MDPPVPKSRPMSTTVQEPLSLRFLGEIEVARGARRLDLPQSKKTRALLAYLVVSARPHRRADLCSLLWDVADDPRGALRWSLSKLRPLVNEPGCERIVTRGERVSFTPAGAAIDLYTVRDRLSNGVDTLDDTELAALATATRGEFLAGLELPHFPDYQSWCTRQREEARLLYTQILRALVARLAAEPARALPHAEALVHADPLDATARVACARLLAATGRTRDAEEQLAEGRRLFQELGQDPPLELATPVRAAAPAASDEIAAESAIEPVPPSHRLVGRRNEMAELLAALDQVAGARRERVVLLSGEPGLGKTRLLAELVLAARARGATVLAGAAFEVESGRPYGPWIDALRRLPRFTFGDVLRGELAPLLPELASTRATDGTRERLFGAVSEIIAARAHSAPPVVLIFDDAQWIDEASAELLHYVARSNAHRPFLIALAARAAELPDNIVLTRILRAWQRGGIIAEIALGPLGAEETRELVREVAPQADPEPCAAESGGNPLYALELARALPHRGDRSRSTLAELVRDRLERLPAAARDVLSWAAVHGKTIRTRRLERLVALDAEALAGALDTLERHGLLTAAGGDLQELAFGHDVVRHIIYSDLSAPRRRLMHARIATLLAAEESTDESAIADIAHHASLAGDAALAARSCVAAGRRCLRLFANAAAASLARRGARYADELPELERVKLHLELAEIGVTARRPAEPEDTARGIEELSERALDLGAVEHARLGFHLLSYLRWEGGDTRDAERYTKLAEMVSRAADEKERVIALAEAARCLALLERDLPRAQALVQEAEALAGRVQIEPMAIPDALGLLRLHEGRLDEAAALFAEARTLARRDGDRRREFQALEHLAWLEFERQSLPAAEALAGELAALGAKLPAGSEAPLAAALVALARMARGDEAAPTALDAALSALRDQDAKQRQLAVLLHAAELDLRSGRPAPARARAAEAVRIAAALGRESEVVIARAALARAAAALGDRKAEAAELAALDASSLALVSAAAKLAAAAVRNGARPGSRRRASARGGT